jgi:pimeloyl-ACP methyl ester carboxylesterase
MPYAGVNGVKLYYEIEGQGPALALVHEFAGSARSWAPQVAAFRSRYRVLTYNCRGYPPSTVPGDPGAYSQDLSIEDLRRLLEHLRIEEVCLLGFSMGGGIALNFAIRHPGGVRALVLVGTGSGSEDRSTFAAAFGAVADRLEREGAAAVADDYLRGPTRVQLLRKRPGAWERLREEFGQLSGAGLANTIRRAITRRPAVYELAEELRTLPVPTLVLVGAEDQPALKASEFLAATIPGARLQVFPRSGHMLNLEEPDRFNAAVLGFLDQTGAVSRAPEGLRSARPGP